jgi:hypothetical protein
VKWSTPSLIVLFAPAFVTPISSRFRWIAREQERFFGRVLGVVEATAGRLNVNDALLVVLQREGMSGEVASFDSGFDAVSDSPGGVVSAERCGVRVLTSRADPGARVRKELAYSIKSA